MREAAAQLALNSGRWGGVEGVPMLQSHSRSQSSGSITPQQEHLPAGAQSQAEGSSTFQRSYFIIMLRSKRLERHLCSSLGISILNHK